VSEADDPRLQIVVGGRTVGAHLEAAIARGDVERREDGHLTLRRNATPTDAIGRRGGFLGRAGATHRFCMFLNDFLFDQAYGQTTVPFACRSCFKIRIPTRSLRAMMAVKEIAESTEFTTKSGSDVDDPTNEYLYSTYLYFNDLEQARDAYQHVRARIDRHAHLGPGVAMLLKRGCSNYERQCGPSDRYTFDPRLEAVEAYLAERFVDDRPPRGLAKETVKALRMLNLIQIAYRIGDETYKDFTAGKPLLPPLVDYSPSPELDAEAAPAETARPA
jgi:hypothetical protein